MMPKGVEHKSALLDARGGFMVGIPMMPKGVEHFCIWQPDADLLDVGIPMMPKGVEHTMALWTIYRKTQSGNSNDAERR